MDTAAWLGVVLVWEIIADRFCDQPQLAERVAGFFLRR